jgi:nucleoside 2-deoxyribosyltransferase
VGAAYEMGFMRALGRPVFAYSNDAVRTTSVPPSSVLPWWWRARARADGLAIEPLGLHDNLMLIGRVTGSGGRLVTKQVEHAAGYTLLAVFERCVRFAAAALLRGTGWSDAHAR